MSNLDDYLGKVQGLLILADEVVPSAQSAEAWHLVDHGEPAEGLCALAWIIVDNNLVVDRSIIEGIRSLTEGMVDPSDLPPDLDQHRREETSPAAPDNLSGRRSPCRRPGPG